MTSEGRVEMGFLLRLLQRGESLGLPWSRPMPSIGARCHELRVREATAIWRLIYRVDSDAIVILEVFAKKTKTTPQSIVDICRKRIRAYDARE